MSLCRTAFPARAAHIVVEQELACCFSVPTVTKVELTSPHATKTAIAHMKSFDLGVTSVCAALLCSGDVEEQLPSPGIVSEWRKPREQPLP